ncbi:MAG: hypothetical protein ACJ776_04535 [Chloroflexota bacterium]
MTNRQTLLGLLAIVLVAGCGPTTVSPTSSTALAAASPSPSAESAAPTAAPTATATAAPTARSSPTATPLPTATPVPTAAPTPVPWQSYRSKRFHYKIKYPPGWIVTPGTTKTADQFDEYVAPWVTVYRDTVAGLASVNLTVTRDVAYYKSHYKAKLLSNKPIKLDGWLGRILTFKGSRDGRTLLMQHIIIAKGRIGYFIDMDGDYDQAAPDKALFRTMYKTWRAT